jgi:DNA-binding MarR family transcriptional regulator
LSEDLTDLQRNIIAMIVRDNRRPSSIAFALKRRNGTVDQNRVMQALVDLEKRGLVERSTSKAWTAKSKATDYIEAE